jgi:hypothetical protein
MDSLRLLAESSSPAEIACCRCGEGDGRWDRIADKAYCPACQEAIVLGVAKPLAERTERKSCAACSHLGTVRYLTFPLHTAAPVEIDLCSEHLRSLLGRRLGPHAYHQLRRQLLVLGLEREQIFLLHEAFYDLNGRALQPAAEPE